MSFRKLFKRRNAKHRTSEIPADEGDNNFTVVSSHHELSKNIYDSNSSTSFEVKNKANSIGTSSISTDKAENNSEKEAAPIVEERPEKNVESPPPKENNTECDNWIWNNKSSTNDELSIIATERLRHISNDPLIPLAVRNFVNGYLREHGSTYIREEMTEAKDNSMRNDKRIVNSAIVVAESEISSRNSVRAQPSPRFRTVVSPPKRQSVISERLSRIELDWPFQLHQTLGSLDDKSPATLTMESIEDLSLNDPKKTYPPTFQNYSRGRYKSRMARYDSLSNTSASSGAPSLTSTEKSGYSEYSAISDVNYEICENNEFTKKLLINVSRCDTTKKMRYPTPRNRMVRSTFCQSAKDFNRPMSWRKTDVTADLECFELSNPNAYCGSRAMSGPYPCIPNRRSIRPDGAFKRQSVVIPVSFSIDEFPNNLE